jgi:SAM-dependent methyltransferase
MPIAPQVQYFTCIEPAEKWWRDKIGETPAKYISPRPDGIVPLDDSTVDLVVALSVLHHVPNVSTILREVARVMRRGGRFILHEPIISMGDWRQNRPGLTKNERGLPLPWLRQMIVNCGFSIEKLNYCQFPTTSRLGRLLGVSPYNNLAMIWQDHMISELMRWNLRYHRRNFFEKLTPTAIFTILRKN